MTPAAASGVPVVPGLLDEYLAWLPALGLGDKAVRDRVRIARDFTGRNPDLTAWMTLPPAYRVSELKRTGAWPLVCHAIGTGRLRLDLELAGAKNLTGLARVVEARDPAAFAAARAAALRLGWQAAWTETVLGECLAVLLAWHGGQASDLTSDVVDAFDAGLTACTTIPPTSRRAYRARLAGARQLLFETRVIDTPPARRPWARTLEQRFDDVTMAPQIRQVLVRYVRTRTAVLRPRSVESLINDLLPFAEYLSSHHPGITSLRKLRRDHVEGYLTWNRTRPWRGQRAAAGNGRAVSAAVAQSTVLTLRNMLDDIADWGWSEAPPRRLVFAADVPKLGQPLPRALPPDVDQALMNAVAGLDDDFARIGLTVLRGAGLRIGELLDLEIGSIIDYGPAGTWLLVPLGKLATERMVPLDAATLTVLDEWAAHRGAHRPVPHPRTGAPVDFLFTSRGRRLGTTRLRNGLLAAAGSAGLRGPGNQVLVVTCHQLRHTWATSLANAGMSLQALMALLGHYAGDLVKLIMLGGRLAESGEQPVEDLLPADLPFVRGVVALGLKGGTELDGGLEERAGLADRLEVAVQSDWPGAVAVAEHPAVHLGSELAHLGTFGVGGQLSWGVVECFDFLRHREVLVGHGPVGDPGIDHGHSHRSMSEKGGDCLERHAPVDGLGGQRMPELVRGDVSDSRRSGYLGDGPVDPALGDPPTAVDEQVVAAQARGPAGDPVVEQVFELRVQGDVAVGAQLADRHVQPVGRSRSARRSRWSGRGTRPCAARCGPGTRPRGGRTGRGWRGRLAAASPPPRRRGSGAAGRRGGAGRRRTPAPRAGTSSPSHSVRRSKQFAQHADVLGQPGLGQPPAAGGRPAAATWSL